MNRQVLYITYAHLLFAIIAGGLFLFKKIHQSSSLKHAVEQVVVSNNAVEKKLSDAAVAGKTLFQAKCQACHNLFKPMTGPALMDFTSRGPWTERMNVYAWIRNPQAFAEKDDYVRSLIAQYNGAMMTPFPNLKDQEIDQIIAFVEESR